MPIREVRFPTRIKNALFAAGLKTVGEVREMSDEALLSLPDFGKASVAHLRFQRPQQDQGRTFGMSTIGVDRKFSARSEHRPGFGPSRHFAATRNLVATRA